MPMTPTQRRIWEFEQNAKRPPLWVSREMRADPEVARVLRWLSRSWEEMALQIHHYGDWQRLTMDENHAWIDWLWNHWMNTDNRLRREAELK